MRRALTFCATSAWPTCQVCDLEMSIMPRPAGKRFPHQRHRVLLPPKHVIGIQLDDDPALRRQLTPPDGVEATLAALAVPQPVVLDDDLAVAPHQVGLRDPGVCGVGDLTPERISSTASRARLIPREIVDSEHRSKVQRRIDRAGQSDPVDLLDAARLQAEEVSRRVMAEGRVDR